ncbi:hypothetical protein PU629_13515 [Pullulanibacillus sp. KACC 23026]|uniref:hypothetical protein n=1 Tax=Pullulanibacillus sp. KACC 23026 TaxID=3028315 RepID=UPI0023B1F205|nr:hypothetical protein [Pullulanibacillus sp. KACC 23026]WEG11184.1 hypothetical protein PU629_13515 [Pullulanibacillus sp. KACC 23026]
MENKRFKLQLSPSGNLTNLVLKEDAHQMNWVIDTPYLDDCGYDESDKLFGNFSLKVKGEVLISSDVIPTIVEDVGTATVSYVFEKLEVIMNYDLSQSDDRVAWTITLKSRTVEDLEITDFAIWSSFSYVMYRINDLDLQTNHSASVNPSISEHFSKIACVRRSNEAPHLGMYQTKGQTLSVGSYCAYKNLFFESVSPSLDGLLFHQLILAGGYPENFENADWIYEKKGFVLPGLGEKEWGYAFEPFKNQQDFHSIGLTNYGHPSFDFEPLAILDQPYVLAFELPEGRQLTDAYMDYLDIDGKRKRENLLTKIKLETNHYQADLDFTLPGETKITIELDNEFYDSVVLNVMEPIKKTLDHRVRYISDVLFNGENSDTPYSYSPISNQGESLGKLSLVLKTNLLGETNVEAVQKVEASCVYYIRQKWFENGDFTKPTKLYGEFYRCMDFEYMAHVFYLLSKFQEDVLQLNHPDTYLAWAADVFSLRVNPDLHDNARGKEEAQMLGVFFLYIDDLLEELRSRGLTEKYDEISVLWSRIAENVATDSKTYKAAVTEHFFDNAGFGPAAGALASTHHLEGAKRYGELVLANIGFSNDFRAQSPDRWWEALSYMIHSLWGGVTAAACLKAYEALKDSRYLKAAYRATVGILYCYDTNAKATDTKLASGEAASTYSIAGPHINRPDLSRNRFGQSTFFRDGGIFSRLFTKEEETADWDMGEELVAYLDGFGRKTFLYEESGTIFIVNGSIEETDEGLLITSYAPFPTDYHFYDRELHFVSKNGELVPQILLADGAFKPKKEPLLTKE